MNSDMEMSNPGPYVDDRTALWINLATRTKKREKEEKKCICVCA